MFKRTSLETKFMHPNISKIYLSLLCIYKQDDTNKTFIRFHTIRFHTIAEQNIDVSPVLNHKKEADRLKFNRYIS